MGTGLCLKAKLFRLYSINRDACLLILMRVPITVKNDNSVCRLKVETKTTSPSTTHFEVDDQGSKKQVKSNLNLRMNT